jgi:DNA-binding CsgD family transcriptional regulator/tetratricopeptide (TPR) repeat protein
LTVQNLVSFDDAYFAWFTGDFERCITFCDALACDGCGSNPTTLLLARSLLRLDLTQDALNVLEAMSDCSEADQASRSALVGCGLTQLGQPDRALEVLRQVDATASFAEETKSERAVYDGAAHFALRDLEAAEVSLERVSRGSTLDHVRALECKGRIAIGRGENDAAIRLFAAALKCLDECEQRDPILEIGCVQGLATLAVEALDREIWQAVTTRRARLKSRPNAPSLVHFQLALAAATFENEVEGRPQNAALEARRAYELAPTTGYRVQALCKRASIARCAGESIAHADHLQAALDAADGIDGVSPAGNDLAFLALVEELALANRPGDARTYLQRYRVGFVPAAEAERGRLGAQEDFATANTAEAEGRRSEAIALYESVARRSSRYSPRLTALSAVRLASITGSIKYIEDHAPALAEHVTPTSWLYMTLKDIAKSNALASLTPLHHEYMTMLSKGFTNSRMAKARGRSEYTVRNQVSALIGMFGVQNRTELVTEYLRVVQKYQSA